MVRSSASVIHTSTDVVSLILAASCCARSDPAELEIASQADSAVALPPYSSKQNNRVLTHCHIACMVFHMKTTLNIDDTVMASLRREAARSGRTMSELVETALRQLLRRRVGVTELAPLPTFDSGGALVDVADRDALYRAMEESRDER